MENTPLLVEKSQWGSVALGLSLFEERYGEKGSGDCNAPIPYTEDNTKISEFGALLLGKSENFQDRSPQ